MKMNRRETLVGTLPAHPNTEVAVYFDDEASTVTMYLVQGFLVFEHVVYGISYDPVIIRDGHVSSLSIMKNVMRYELVEIPGVVDPTTTS